MKKVFYFSLILIFALIIFLAIQLLSPNNTETNNTVTEKTNKDILLPEISKNIEISDENDDSVIDIGSDIGWHEITRGNLKAVEEDGKWILYSVNLAGSYLPSQDVYEVDKSIIRKLPSQLIYINTYILKSDNKLYDTTYKQSSINGNMVKIKNNDLIISDEYYNFWLVDHISGEGKPFLDMTGFEEAKKIVQSSDIKGFLVWAYNPYITENKETIIFESNRETVKNNIFSNSIYAVDENGHNLRLILNAEKYNQAISLLGVNNNLVIAYLNESDSIIIYNLTDSTEKEIEIGGCADSLSPDGKYLLFRKNPNGIEREFYLLNLADGTEEYIGMPDDYFYNDNGAWSPDSKKFAFYLNGNSNNLPNKSYRTNVKIAVIDIETKQIDIYDRPSDKSYLYTSGSISWLGNNQIICYTDDNTTWLLRLE